MDPSFKRTGQKMDGDGGAAVLHVSSPFKDPGCQNLCQLTHPHPSELEVGKTAWSARCRVLNGSISLCSHSIG